MGITSVKELARTFEQEVGKPVTAKRAWVCVLDDNTLTGSPLSEWDVITQTTGGTWGAAHPTFTVFGLRKITITEGHENSPYHVHVVGEYSIVRDEEVIAPTSRPAVWNFDAKSGEFPALFYYSGSGNNTKYPLTNSAYDYFPGLTTQESLVTAVVKKNFSTFPSSWYAANNFLNNATYLGCATHCLRVDGVKTSYVYEEWGGSMVKYWAAEATLTYRESGWNLQLPDIGWNYLDGGVKRRAMVFDFQNGEWVASANPVGLDGNGGQTLGAPAILTRRVNPETNFTTLFGSGPS